MQEMPDDEATTLGAAVFMAVFLGVPVISVISNKGWIEGVLELDTLIGGVLAVFAAYFTVRQMRISDAAAEERHQASLRASTIRMRREIEKMIFSLERAWFFCLRDNGWVSQLKFGEFEQSETTMQALRSCVDQVLAEINSDAVRGAEDLLDMDLRNAIHSIRAILGAVSVLVSGTHDEVLAAAYQASHGMREMEVLRPRYIEWKAKTLVALGERQSV